MVNLDKTLTEHSHNMKKVSNDFKIKNARFKSAIKDNLELLIFTVPAVISLILFNYLPMLGFVMAFKDYRFSRGIYNSEWNGLKNFEFFFKSQDAWIVTRNTIAYNSLFIVLGIIFSVFMALLLYEITNKLATKIYQTIMILPYFLSWVIVSYISYMLLNPELGVINKILQSLSIKPVQWYADTTYWPLILTVFYIWKSVGMSCIIYYAALMGIDHSLYEAARMDGASHTKQILYISIPCIMPVILIMFILSVGGILGGDFGLFYQITRDSGTLYPVTDIIPTYVFRALKNGGYAVGTAVSLFQSVVGFILVIAANFVVKKIDPEKPLF